MDSKKQTPSDELARKRKLLIAKKLNQLSEKNTKIKAHKHDEPVPLSFAQQRLWFLDKLVPNSSLYNIFNVLHFPSQLNLTVFHKCLQEIVRRHESLRTIFKMVDGNPKQIILPEIFVPLPVVDVTKTVPSHRQAELAKIINTEAQKPFQISTGPLVRATLIKRSQQDYIFLLAMHHIITDGWSMNVFFKELTDLYEAFSKGLPSPYTELPIQYPDFAVWQRNWLKGAILEKQLNYWENKLKDCSPLQIPTDHPRSSVQTFVGTTTTFELPSYHHQSLKKICQRKGMTMFMVLLGILKVLIYRLTGKGDIVIGSPISGRTRTELEGLIGFFVNTLVFGTKLKGNDSFEKVLDKVKETALGAYSHQDLPFEMLVEKQQIERDLSQNPIFQIMFQVVSKNSKANKGGDDLPLIKMGSAKFDLTFSFDDYLDSLVGLIEYNTDLFEATTIDRIIYLFKNLTHQVIENPDQDIRELSMLNDTEYQRIIYDLNDTDTDYPASSSLPVLFQQQARALPDKLACKYGKKELTYHEMEERSNQLARYLREKHQVGFETIVGLCMERSPELLVAILGIIKAGACYLPLDLDYPSERLTFMLEDANAALVITQPDKRSVLGQPSTKLLDYSFDASEVQVFSRRPLDLNYHPELAAYIMYTSGSTGRPKGITIPHRGILRLVCNTNYIELKSSDIFAQASNTSFDASTFEIWGALLNGASLIGIDKTMSINPKEYFKKIEEENINTVFATTALFNQFGKQAPWAFRSVEKVLFGGEAATAKWVFEVLQNSSPRTVLNLYGPTESTTFATYFSPKNLPKTSPTIPIGHAISNTQVYVLDANLEPVPIGVPGELYIGGDGLARGYVNKPKLTAANFLPDPFSKKPGSRMYRTKDLVRMDEEGQITFIGRVDNQVKLRGFRIELGEIESHLNRLPTIKDSIVMLRQLANGSDYLVAYLEMEGAERPASDTIKLALKKQLPEYMVPAAMVMLDQFPYSPNGKIDRKKLPEPEMAGANKKRANSTAALTKTQQVISEIWKEVLGLDSVSIHDNFFDIGGHSLMIALVNNRLQEELHREIPVIDLFQYPTIYSLATRLESTTEAVDLVDHKGLTHIKERVSNRKLAMQRRRKARKRVR